jgi:hypothetical protein
LLGSDANPHRGKGTSSSERRVVTWEAAISKCGFRVERGKKREREIQEHGMDDGAEGNMRVIKSHTEKELRRQ